MERFFLGIVVVVAIIGLVGELKATANAVFDYYPQLTSFPVKDGAVYYNSKGSFFNTPCKIGSRTTSGRTGIFPSQPTPVSNSAFEQGVMQVYLDFPGAENYAVCFAKTMGGGVTCWIYSGADYQDLLATRISDRTFCDYRMKTVVLSKEPMFYSSISLMLNSSVTKQ